MAKYYSHSLNRRLILDYFSLEKFAGINSVKVVTPQHTPAPTGLQRYAISRIKGTVQTYSSYLPKSEH